MPCAGPWRSLADAGDVTAVSPLYETEPVGGPEDQGPYLNVVVELATTDSPRQLLARCRAAGGGGPPGPHGPLRPPDARCRCPPGGRPGVDEPDLVVPHPRMWERRFVLQPLADLAPELVPPEQLAAAGGEVTCVGML